MATKPVNPSGKKGVSPVGGTFLTWGRFPRKYWLAWDIYGSYGTNAWIRVPYDPWGDPDKRSWRRTPYVRGASNIPMQMDSSFWFTWVYYPRMRPPERDAIPTARVRAPFFPHPSCINRHDGYVNGLFFDWSVRKVGLKELWTLKWHRKVNTAGPWTKAGGVLPQDWPKWMRRFKDY